MKKKMILEWDDQNGETTMNVKTNFNWVEIEDIKIDFMTFMESQSRYDKPDGIELGKYSYNYQSRQWELIKI